MIATSRVYEVWRELTSIHNALPEHHRDLFYIDWHLLVEWAGSGRAGIATLAELERQGKITTAHERHNGLGIRMVELFPYKTVRELIEGYSVPDEPIHERTEIHDIEATTDADRRAAEAWATLEEVVQAVKERRARSLWRRVMNWMVQL